MSDTKKVDDDNEEIVDQASDGSEVLEMSDEEFLKLDDTQYSEVEAAEPTEEEEEEEEKEEEQAEESEEDSSGDAQEEETTDSGSEEEQPQSEEDTETSNDEQPEVDYKAEYEKIFGPIKANGKTVKMKNSDQVVNRIQLAENYHKKMHDMRPHAAMLKTLEKAGVLDDQDKINFMLDLQSGNPEAIKKLIADNKIDIVDLADDTEPPNGERYQPSNHMVSDAEVAVSEALKSISHSERYDDTLSVMTETFDPKSREIISNNPDYIQSLNQDIENGIYDKVMDEVRYGREMRHIPAGTPDIEAYINTVRMMAEQEVRHQQQQQQQAQNQPQQVEKPRKKRVDAGKRKAMSSPASGGSSGKKQFNPIDVLSMSDEDFNKQFGTL